MQFHSKRPEPPKAGDRMTLVSTRTVEIRDDKPAANQPKHGKLNYLAGPPKKKVAKPAPSGRRLVERKSLSIGKYIGNGQQLTAFVMLDPDEAPKTPAANE
jgi:hypothetical protein